jgi:cellulose synthase/poly-beta-1,6-N-acetylglucosamine synthase-like glycosyltransferase
MAGVLILAYFVVLGALAMLGVYRLHLTLVVLGKKRAKVADVEVPREAFPTVVVQLPIYNEALVAERILRAAAKLSYPEGRLTLQVLDDSTDETRAIVDRVARDLSGAGVCVTVLRRDDRRGFKAGALAHGLENTGADLVAIFDADFVPPSDFLERIVPILVTDPGCAMVQARWGHRNREGSLLTRAQAIFLDGHFLIEHKARDLSGRFFNFNGTAGVWRRRAIVSAGGWSDDTITEDLDLSYRAQLLGERFRFEENVIADAELPERWAAFRSQQARWVRGSVETARKHLFRVLATRTLPLAVRIDAAIHLSNNFAYLWMAVLALLLPAAVVVRAELAWRVPGGQALLSMLDVTMLTAGTLAMVVFYLVAEWRLDRRPFARIFDVILALAIGAGMSISNAREVLRGCASKGSTFVRTPKRGDASRAIARAKYRAKPPLALVLIESLFFAYFAAATAYAIEEALYGALPFLLLYLIGFGLVAGGSFAEALSSWSLTSGVDGLQSTVDR